MQRVIIHSYHEVTDEVANELFASIKDDETRRLDGMFALLLQFMQENPAYSAWYEGGGMKPGSAPPEQALP